MGVDDKRTDRGWEAVAVGAILLTSAFLRLYGIGWLPPGIFQDEAINGVNAQTILAGAPRLYYGEREPLFMYLAALGTLVFGYTPLALYVTSALSSLLGVAAAGALARQLFGRRIALLTAAGIGASLWLTAIGRIGLRAITLPTVACLGLALLWRATKTGRRRDYVLAGAVLGLCLYTYLSSRFLPIALLVFLALSLIFYRSWAWPRHGGLAIAGISAVVVCLPLGAYALRHPEIILGRPDQVALPGGSAYLPALLDAIERTLGMFALRGDANWRQNLSGAPVFDPLSFAVFLIGVLAALRWRKPETLLTLVVAAVMIVPSMLSVDSPHYLRTAGAAGAIYILWALGLDRSARWIGRWVKSGGSTRETAPRAVSTPSGAPTGIHRRAWGSGLASLVDTARGAVSLSAAFVAIVLVVAYGRTAKGYFVDYAQSPQMRAAFSADLAAVGRFVAASPVWREDRANVYVTDDYRDNLGSIAYFLYPRLTPAERATWLDERTIGTLFGPAETVPLPVAPSLYVVPPDDRTTAAALGPAVRRVVPILDGNRVAAQAIFADPALANGGGPVRAQFGDWLALESAQIQPDVVTLRWQIVKRLTYQPSIFVHVEDAAGHTLATSDQVTRVRFDAWRVGQELLSRHAVQVPPGTPPGEYPITVGAYDKENGHREPARANGEAVSRVEVGRLALATPVPGVAIVQQHDDLPVAPGLRLLGHDLPNASPEAGSVVPLALVWQAQGTQRPDDEVVVALRAADGSMLTEWQGAPGGASFPTSRWAPGASVRQLLDLSVPPTFQGAAALVIVGPGSGGQTSGVTAPVEIARLMVKGTAHVFTPPRPATHLNASFAGVGALVGADVPDEAAAGSTTRLTLYWQATGASSAPYTVFSHVLDAQSHVVGQRDEPPVHGSRPTTSWVAAEFITDPHELTIDPKTPPGSYQLEVGLYDPQTGARVPTGTPDNRIVIGQIQVR